MSAPDDQVVIIGAGPAGMAAAAELMEANRDFVVVEKESAVGGLSRTYTFREGDDVFLTDNGPHRFFSKNPYLYQFVESLLGEQWIRVTRHTQQYIAGTFFDYPIRVRQVLSQLGLLRVARVLFDYLAARVRFGLLRRPIRTYEDYLVANFGRALAEFNMINYSEKIWGIPTSRIHPDWGQQRIKNLSLLSLVREAVGRAGGRKKGTPKSLVDEFFYPEFGTGLIYEAVEKKISAAGRSVVKEARPTSIEHENRRITKLRILQGDQERILVPSHLIESIPIDEFVQLLDPAAPNAVLKAAHSLRYRDQVYLFLTLDQSSVSPNQWIYFPEPEIPFGRVSEMKNFSAVMAPPGKTSLLVEYFCFEGDQIWSLPDHELVDLTMKHLERMNLCQRESVRQSYVFRKTKVYPIYDLEYQQHLAVMKTYLDGFENLFYVGRPGRFRYTNQDHSLEMGILAARNIIEGTQHSIDAVGSDDSYFEGGTSPQRSS